MLAKASKLIRPALAAWLVAMGAVALSGCGKSPESVCKKVQAIRDKEDKDSKKSDDDKKKELDDCVKRAEKEKAENPKKWDCMAPCADKETWKEVRECTKVCEKDDKKEDKK